MKTQKSKTAFFLAVLTICLLLAAGMPVFAQNAAPAQPVEGQKGEASDVITFTAQRMESVLAKGKEKTILIGAAVVNTGSIEIRADRIELSGTDYNNLVCIGTVKVKDESKGFALVSDNLEYARDTEIGLAQSAVVLEDSKNNVILKAEWVRFDQKQSIVDARIAVHILKEDFAVRAEYARYNRDTESLELSGKPTIVSPDGTITADTVSGKPTMDNLTLSGQVSGTITTKKKEGTTP